MDEEKKEKPQEKTAAQERKPDERSGILIQAHVKIFDPESEEIFVNGRA